MTVEAQGSTTTSAIGAGSRPGGRRRRRLPSWIAAVGWVVVAALALVAVMRLFAWDRFYPFAILDTVTLFVYLPAWVVVVVAAVGRRFVLAAAALVVVVLQVVFLLPELTAAQPVPPWATRVPAVRLMDANVSIFNHSMDGYAAQIEQTRPDLLTLEEATPRQVGQLQRSGSLEALPYRFEVYRGDQKAFLVASRYPLSDTRVVYFESAPLVVQVVVRLPSGNRSLWVVHTSAPLPNAFGQWQGQLAAIARYVRARGPRGLLLVGDFNATWGNKGFKTILDAGLTDAAAARGHALDMTWTQSAPPLPPVARIDHVLTGPGLAVTQIDTEPGPGSDHRDLHATIAIDPT